MMRAKGEPELASNTMTEIVTLQRGSSRPCFAWLVPAWFLFGALLGVVWPGSEWELFAVGALPGSWAAVVFDSGAGTFGWLLPTLLAGLPLMWLLGSLLDKLGTDLRLWVLFAVGAAVVAGFLLLQSFNDLQLAIDKHGSLYPFAVCAWQLGNYAATLLLLAIGAGRGTRR